MLTEQLSKFTEFQIAFVQSLYIASVQVIRDTCKKCSMPVTKNSTKTIMIGWILKSLDKDEVKKELCASGLARMDWF